MAFDVEISGISDGDIVMIVMIVMMTLVMVTLVMVMLMMVVLIALMYSLFTDAVNPTVGTFDVKLVKTGCLNLGISIGGDKPLWIADIKKGGVAHRFGSLQPGDALLAVDNQSLENAAPIDAVNLLKNSGRVVILTIRKESLNSMSELFIILLHFLF